MVISSCDSQPCHAERSRSVAKRSSCGVEASLVQCTAEGRDSSAFAFAQGRNDNPLVQETEYAYACWRADVDFAVGDHGRDEFVAGAEVVASAGGLVTVVQLLG
jgi:hypothetical protein